MARIFIDGFESGGDDLWDAESNATVVSSAGLDMDGSYCLDINAGPEYVQKDITADDEMYFAFLYRCTTDSYDTTILTAFNGATILIRLFRDIPAGTLGVKRGSTTITTGTKVLIINTTYLIEVHLKIADSGGRVEVKVDNIQDIDFTGDTQTGADTQFDKIRLGYADFINSYAYFDNFIMDDAAWIGDTKIQAVVPTGAGNTTGWTPSAGANWECVDEKPASDADYVSINSNDVVDTYATGDLAGTIGAVKCVQVQSRMRTDGAPTPTQLQLAVRNGGTDYFSSSHTVPAAEKALWNLWEQNPAAAAAWTETTVNSMEVGIKSIA